MQRWLNSLASLKLTVVLLLMILVALAAGTIVESMSGTMAARGVYYAPWFYALLGIFSLNLIAAIIQRFPWGRFRIGFVLTHSSMVVIFVGALLSHFTGTQGSLSLWEGDELAVFQERVAPTTQRPHTLPFSVRLDSFEIDVYQGTQRPAMFRSRVQVTDTADGTTFPAIIEMNKELAYKGYRLFQSSYRIDGGREMTILSVSKDPGQTVVFVGYFMLMAGMITVLGTRITARRIAARHEAARAAKRADASQASVAATGATGAGRETPPVAASIPSPSAPSASTPGASTTDASTGRSNHRTPVSVAIIALSLASLLAGSSSAGTIPDTESVDALRSLPVQHDGRIMPLDTVARVAVREVTGGQVWNGLDPVAVVLGWGFHFSSWSQDPMLKIGNKDLAEQIGMAGRSHASFDQIVSNGAVHDIVGKARMAQRQKAQLTKSQEAALELESRLVTMNAFMTKEGVPGHS